MDGEEKPLALKLANLAPVPSRAEDEESTDTDDYYYEDEYEPTRAAPPSHPSQPSSQQVLSMCVVYVCVSCVCVCACVCGV